MPALPRRLTLSVPFLFVLAACQQQAELTDPLQRQPLWFAVVEGADLRAGCAAGETSWRAVYNARYRQQVRVFTLQQQTAGADWTFTAYGREPTNLISLPVSFDDPLSPFRGREEKRNLTAAEGSALALRLVEGLTPVTQVMTLRGDDYWWVLHRCENRVWTTYALTPAEGSFSRWAGAQALASAAPLPPMLSPPPVPEHLKAEDRLFDYPVTIRPQGMDAMPKMLSP